ncbi:hypothetical protein CDAR_53951 [Caerostris darwini]|uniref:Uncharacterized protein n=1 Tax=Caerostris darwini TaxID=1538125 RepID=A0AAV4WEC4_9ARAC|nr:hypothetical protein CDAR_53951 [Caerostris darwini]
MHAMQQARDCTTKETLCIPGNKRDTIHALQQAENCGIETLCIAARQGTVQQKRYYACILCNERDTMHAVQEARDYATKEIQIMPCNKGDAVQPKEYYPYHAKSE